MFPTHTNDPHLHDTAHAPLFEEFFCLPFFCQNPRPAPAPTQKRIQQNSTFLSSLRFLLFKIRLSASLRLCAFAFNTVQIAVHSRALAFIRGSVFPTSQP
jgi:hypothetical protein